MIRYVRSRTMAIWPNEKKAAPLELLAQWQALALLPTGWCAWWGLGDTRTSGAAPRRLRVGDPIGPLVGLCADVGGNAQLVQCSWVAAFVGGIDRGGELGFAQQPWGR